jgi:hypothetical protein
MVSYNTTTKYVFPISHHPSYMVHYWMLVHSGQLSLGVVSCEPSYFPIHYAHNIQFRGSQAFALLGKTSFWVLFMDETPLAHKFIFSGQTYLPTYPPHHLVFIAQAQASTHHHYSPNAIQRPYNQGQSQ